MKTSRMVIEFLNFKRAVLLKLVLIPNCAGNRLKFSRPGKVHFLFDRSNFILPSQGLNLLILS